MTTNQISLYKIRTENEMANKQLAELKRQNIASLNETTRHNISVEDVQKGTLLSNLGQWKSNLAETIRHNTAQEQELLRSNLAKESQNALTLDETRRSNLARERETRRSNLASEANEGRKVSESIRHNLASEAENQRASMAKEFESNRHNVAVENQTRDENLRQASFRIRDTELKEQQMRQDFQIQKDRDLETLRHNLAMEDQAAINQEEVERSNKAQEQLKDEAQAEIRRSNKTNETTKAWSVAADVVTGVVGKAFNAASSLVAGWVA